MRNKLKELDVDFIGGQEKPLTKEEEIEISNFIKQLKKKPVKSAKRKVKIREKRVTV